MLLRQRREVGLPRLTRPSTTPSLQSMARKVCLIARHLSSTLYQLVTKVDALHHHLARPLRAALADQPPLAHARPLREGGRARCLERFTTSFPSLAVRLDDLPPQLQTVGEVGLATRAAVNVTARPGGRHIRSWRIAWAPVTVSAAMAFCRRRPPRLRADQMLRTQ